MGRKRNEDETEHRLDETYAKNIGNAQLTYLLDCVRRGNPRDIEAVFSDSEYCNLSRRVVGNNLALAHTVLQYILPQIIRAGVDGGMAWPLGAELYINYLNNSQQIRSCKDLLELQNQIYLDVADRVAQVNRQFSSIVRRCNSYIDQHLYEPLSTRRIAEALQISTSYLSHIYRQETGETISATIREKKINKAKMLLQYSTLSLNSIGEKLGYCSQSHFTNAFRKKTSLTPREFRSKYLQRDSLTLREPTL